MKFTLSSSYLEDAQSRKRASMASTSLEAINTRAKRRKPSNSANPPQDFLSSFPDDLIREVMTFCSLKMLCNLSMTSLSFQDFIEQALQRHVKFELASEETCIGGLQYLMEHGVPLQTLILDYHARISRHRKPLSQRPMLFDKHLKSLRFAKLDSLQTLVLKSCISLTEEGFMSFACNRTLNLTMINLSYMPNATAKVIQMLFKNSPNAEYVCLEKCYNGVTDQTIDVISRFCPSIKTLSLAYCCFISDNAVNNISMRLEGLMELSLAHCYDVSATALANMAQRLTNLEVLSLEWCFNVDSTVVMSLSEHCTKMRVLGIEHCDKITDEGLCVAATRFPHMTFLSADSCAHLAQRAIASIAQSMTGLVDLYVNSCTKISDEDVKLVVKHCFKIRSLGIEECGISDVSVLAVAQYLTELVVLGLNGNAAVTDKGLVVLITTRPGILRLYLSKTGITNTTLATIATHCTSLVSLSAVDCNVNSVGLMALGGVETICSKTLCDVHLSTAMRYHNVFYSNFTTSKGKKPSNITESNDDDSTKAVLYDNEDSYLDDDAISIAASDVAVNLNPVFEAVAHDHNHGHLNDENIPPASSIPTMLYETTDSTLNLQMVIFGQANNLRVPRYNICQVYLR